MRCDATAPWSSLEPCRANNPTMSQFDVASHRHGMSTWQNGNFVIVRCSLLSLNLSASQFATLHAVRTLGKVLTIPCFPAKRNEKTGLIIWSCIFAYEVILSHDSVATSQQKKWNVICCEHPFHLCFRRNKTQIIRFFASSQFTNLHSKSETTPAGWAQIYASINFLVNIEIYSGCRILHAFSNDGAVGCSNV